jgi:hypothetical protein
MTINNSSVPGIMLTVYQCRCFDNDNRELKITIEGGEGKLKIDRLFLGGNPFTCLWENTVCYVTRSFQACEPYIMLLNDDDNKIGVK